MAVVNPDSPSSGAYAVAIPTLDGVTLTPGRLVATSLGTAFVDVLSPNPANNSTPTAIYQLNISAKQFSSTVAPIGPIFGSEYVSASADGTVVFVTVPNDSGGVMFSWSAATNTWMTNEIQQFTADAAVSADGNTLASLIVDPNSGVGLPPYILDQADNVRCQVGVLDVAFPGYGSGIQVDATGALVYVPSGYGIDIFDTHHCDLRERLFLTEQVQTQDTTPTAVDSTGQHIYLLTSNGLTSVTLDAAPLSIGHLVPANGAAGSSITVRGTGFVQGTSATFNGTSSAVTFVDGSTIQVTIPNSLPAGAVSLALSNPDGTTYTLDNAFTIQ